MWVLPVGAGLNHGCKSRSIHPGPRCCPIVHLLPCPTDLWSPMHLFHHPACNLLCFPGPLSSPTEATANFCQGPQAPESAPGQCPAPAPASCPHVSTWHRCVRCRDPPGSPLLSTQDKMGLSPPGSGKGHLLPVPKNAPSSGHAPCPGTASFLFGSYSHSFKCRESNNGPQST